MQIVLLGLAMAIFLHDTPEVRPHIASLPPWMLAAGVLLPKLALLSLDAWLCRRAYRQLTPRRMQRVNRFAAVVPLLALALFVIDLWAGLLDFVRGSASPTAWGSAPRDWVLVDEMLVMLPTLGLMMGGLWFYYPIDRALRERSIIRRADMGLPLYPIWSRSQYLLTQTRNQMALILGPLLLILAWSESINKLHQNGHLNDTAQLWLTPLGAAGVFLLAPLIIRTLWDTVPLPPGPVRDKLTALCDHHGVRVRELLLWRTYGGMINAAVMGLFAPVRFVLLSDGLLDQVEQDRVEAVMAHELAHVKLRHMLWLLLSAAAVVALLSLIGDAVLLIIPTWPAWSSIVLSVIGIGLWAVGFGWVSRRIERQADTFAARHMTLSLGSSSERPPQHFEAHGVIAMTGALQRVADLNHIATTRRSLRHF